MKVVKAMLRAVRDERDRRRERLQSEDPEIAHDQWFDVDQPLINELCLMLLVVIRHNIERELIWTAAQLADGAAVIDEDEYHQNLKRSRETAWKRLAQDLRLEDSPEYGSYETLRLIVNSYKHDPWMGPSEDLVKHLDTQLSQGGRPDRLLQGPFMPLPESDEIRRGIAESLEMDSDSSYCEIVDEFVTRAAAFLTAVANQPHLSAVKRRPVSLGSFAG